MSQAADITTMPILLTSDKRELLGASSSDFGRVSGGIATHVEKLSLDIEEIIHYLHRRWFVANEATQLSKTLLGRFQLKFAEGTPYYSEIAGRVLIQAFEIVGEPCPDGVTHNVTYLLRVDKTKELKDGVLEVYNAAQKTSAVVRN